MSRSLASPGGPARSVRLPGGLGCPDGEHVWRRQARRASGAWTEAAPSPICVPSPALPCPPIPPSFIFAVVRAAPGAVFGAPTLARPPPGPRQGRGGQRSGLPPRNLRHPRPGVFQRAHIDKAAHCTGACEWSLRASRTQRSGAAGDGP
ncbi:hypothetical protein NDU88_001050 [Pleurodeles waltl]|uniref:Uncharacterized protein n=1 Tax=Pleurodeles waltl TaxID=8319 RepID=A0AAV7U5U3_PLEWA|nr:hypothetical protein NDU88_001050 [Pleurodeles waltl]